MIVITCAISCPPLAIATVAGRRPLARHARAAPRPARRAPRYLVAVRPGRYQIERFLVVPAFISGQASTAATACCRSPLPAVVASPGRDAPPLPAYPPASARATRTSSSAAYSTARPMPQQPSPASRNTHRAPARWRSAVTIRRRTAVSRRRRRVSMVVRTERRRPAMGALFRRRRRESSCGFFAATPRHRSRRLVSTRYAANTNYRH